MWSSQLELTCPGHGRVFTVDLNEPAWNLTNNAFGSLARPRKNPLKNKLWKKYVTFHKVSAPAGVDGRAWVCGWVWVCRSLCCA